MKCKYATWLDDNGAQDKRGLSAAAASKHSGVGPTTIKDHRKGECCCGKVAAVKAAKQDAEPADALTGKMDLGPDGGEFLDVQTTEQVTDWTHIFQRFNLDPAEFTIVGDTVRCSTWQQSKRTADGDRDVVNLYSYRAQFKRRTTAGVDLAGLIESVRGWGPLNQPVERPSTAPVSLVVSLADLQIGKGEGDGTKGTLARLERSLASIDDHIADLCNMGHNLERVVIANMGDHTENVAGSYASQTHTVDLNMRDQLTLALEVNMQWIKTLAPMFKHMTYAACLCNHGQMSRGQGRDNVTDDADNATGFIGDTLQTVCNLHPQLDHIDWVVPRDEMITTFQASGVNIAASHGHKISGKEEDWLAKQSQHLTQARHFIPHLWHTAHKHHADIKDYGPYTRIQATTVDPGSKYYLDQSGMYSRPGVTTFIVGEHLPGKWDHYRIH